MKLSIPLSAFALGLALLGCGPDFDPYNELSGLRVLAVRAEPAEIKAGETTTLDALIYNQSKNELEAEWSVCPWPSDPNDGFACVVDQDALDRAWGKAKLEGMAPSLELGAALTASFGFAGDAASGRALCEALAAEVGSSATTLPDCAARWDWTVRLVVRAGKQRVETVKAVTLLLDEEQVPNQNPSLSAFSAVQAKKMVALDAEQPAKLKLDQDHDLKVEVPDEAVETYRPVAVEGEVVEAEKRESLTFTWFVDAGSTDRLRSTYKDGVESLAKATENEWHAPKKGKAVRLYVVVRDHRGGVAFREGRVDLVD